MISIEWIRGNVRAGTYELSNHAFDECENENITDEDVEDVLLNGEILEQYEGRRDLRGDSCLLLGRPNKAGHVHVVVSQCSPHNEMRIVTAYLPKPPKWMNERTRGAQ
jgi:hypothetical protein